MKIRFERDKKHPCYLVKVDGRGRGWIERLPRSDFWAWFICVPGVSGSINGVDGYLRRAKAKIVSDIEAREGTA